MRSLSRVVLAPLAIAVCTTLPLVTAGCLDQDPPAPEPAQAMLAISVIPADVSCLRITATGPGRTLAREVSVKSGDPFTESMSGLPLGSVTFVGEAFPGGCDVVTKSTLPTWVSEPVTTSIIVGRLVTVALTMNRNGRAKVGVEFTDEPICSVAGQICRTDSECCSHNCGAGSCQATDGGADGGGAAM